MVWGREQELAAFLKTAKPYAELLHKADPDIVLQAAAFEIVTPGVESVAIPEHVFKRVRPARRDSRISGIVTCSTPAAGS